MNDSLIQVVIQKVEGIDAVFHNVQFMITIIMYAVVVVAIPKVLTPVVVDGLRVFLGNFCKRKDN